MPVRFRSTCLSLSPRLLGSRRTSSKFQSLPVPYYLSQRFCAVGRRGTPPKYLGAIAKTSQKIQI